MSEAVLYAVTAYIWFKFNFRWGQTPLSEAVLFKHTKIAAILKRHERILAAQNGKGDDGGGEALWIKMVEKKLLKPKDEKKKPAYKVCLIF